MIEIKLTPGQVADADLLAQATFDKWKNHRGNYPNKLTTHRTGKLGEIGVEAWAGGLGVEVDPVFRDIDRDAEADLILVGTRIEVKAWWTQNWETMGRCVRPPQMSLLQRKADAIVWTLLEQADTTISVCVMGWSTPAEVAQVATTVTGPAHLRLENHQVAQADMRTIDSLTTLITRAAL